MTDRIWTPASLWKAALGELELQMTKATFDTWLRGTVAVALDETTITIHCKSTFAQDWLVSTLSRNVNRVLQSISGNDDLTAFFIVIPEIPPTLSDNNAYFDEEGDFVLTKDPAKDFPGAVILPPFVGFDPPRSNWLPLPRPIIEEVMRTEKHTVLALVLAVAGNTLGVIINPHTRASREWWEAGKKEVMQACNFSRGSFYMARKVALLRGYIVMKQGERESCYRLRFVGEPVDNSVDNWD